VARLRRDAEQIVVGERIISGSFVPLTSTPVCAWSNAPEQADIVIQADSDPATWVSARWLREGKTEIDKTRLRHQCFSLSTHPSLLSSQESIDSLRGYLLACLPEGLTTAFLEPIGRAIGCSNRESIALLSLRDGVLAEAGNGAAANELMLWIEDWRARGHPGFDDVEPSVEQTEQGLTVRARLKQP
jgi:hypothetical protein